MTPRECHDLPWIVAAFVLVLLVLVIFYGGRWLDPIVTFYPR